MKLNYLLYIRKLTGLMDHFREGHGLTSLFCEQKISSCLSSDESVLADRGYDKPGVSPSLMFALTRDYYMAKFGPETKHATSFLNNFLC